MDLGEFRWQFPALERYAWLNTPTVPPANRPALEATGAWSASGSGASSLGRTGRATGTPPGSASRS
jgi:hypothetical protein